jgi:hypothetical protein
METHPARGRILGATSVFLVAILCALVSPERTSSQSCCIQPQSESTQAVGTYLTTASSFNQTILDSNGDVFDGMTVQEQPGPAGADTCWFQGSSIPKATAITGGGWVVASGDVQGQANHWGYDNVGWLKPSVDYYRVQEELHGRPLPCGFTIYQQMQILCGSIWQTYTPSFGNKLTGTIDHTTVLNCRYDMNNSSCATINY